MMAGGKICGTASQRSVPNGHLFGVVFALALHFSVASPANGQSFNSTITIASLSTVFEGPSCEIMRSILISFLPTLTMVAVPPSSCTIVLGNALALVCADDSGGGVKVSFLPTFQAMACHSRQQ